MTTQSPSGGPGISVIICTHARAESLRTTLECLARDDRTGVDADVLVVENGGSDEETEAVVMSFRDQLPVRYIYEAAAGKGHGLNRAIAAGSLREIVAVLDDDMSTRPGWFHGVAAICARHPLADFFSGPTTIQWPSQSPPAWVHDGLFTGWGFSAVPNIVEDSEIRPGWCPSGNHYWFRRRVLDDGRRFEHVCAADAWFTFGLIECGYRGVWGPGACAVHRVQETLLSEHAQLRRAATWGRWFTRLRLLHPRTNPEGAYLRDHPLAARVRWTKALVRPALAKALAWGVRDKDRRFVARARATHHLAGNLERLRVRSAIHRRREAVG